MEAKWIDINKELPTPRKNLLFLLKKGNKKWYEIGSRHMPYKQYPDECDLSFIAFRELTKYVTHWFDMDKIKK